MKYLSVLVSGLSGPQGRTVQSGGALFAHKFKDKGITGKTSLDLKLSTRDDFASILPLLGYDIRKYYRGEGSLLAARAGVHLEKDDVAFCCDLVTFKHSQDGYQFQKMGPKVFMESLPPQSLSDDEARELVREINEAVGTETIVFYPVRNYRHLMVWVGGKSKFQTWDPIECSGKPAAGFFPKGDGAAMLTRCMEVASQYLQQHPLTEERTGQGLPPVNGIWFSQPGRAMELPTWEELYDLRSAMVAEDEFCKGIGKMAGFNVLDLEGVNVSSFKDSCLSLAETALKSLSSHDFAFVHIPAEKGGEDASAVFDESFLGTVLAHFEGEKEWKILLMESPAFQEFPLKTLNGPPAREIDFLVYQPGAPGGNKSVLSVAHQLMSRFIHGGFQS